MRVEYIYKSSCVILLASTIAVCAVLEQKFSIRTENDNGDPVESVEVKAWFKLPGENGGINDYFESGFTNAEGIIDLSGRTIWAPSSVEARKDGYYLSIAGDHWTISKTDDNRWEPWPVEVDFTMKRIQNPIPMYAVHPGTDMKFILPIDVEQPVGFDFFARDWLEPYGKGLHADLLVSFSHDITDSKEFPPRGEMKVTFPNPGDGIIPVFDSADGGSILISPNMAPEAGYLNEAVFSTHIHEDGVAPGLDFNRRAWVIRVRSVLDDDGNMVCAKYGKIQGAPQVILFNHGPAFRMTYYLNDDFNDLGLEWDMENNLFEDLPRQHWPRNP